MKRIMKYIFILVIFFVLTSNVYAIKNPYPKYEETIFGTKIINCTWYAWEQAKDNMGVELPLWTYVQTWYDKAKKAGYSVGSEPKANSIMVWDYGEGFGGHVSYVTSVDGNTVNYKEGGSPMTSDGINTDCMTIDMMDSFLVGFIYLDKVPKKEEKPKPVAPSKEETKPKEEIIKVEEKVKSSNNNLSNITISGIDFTFNKNTYDYTFDVTYNVDKITIDARTEDTTAALNGNGTFSLNVGKNIFTIAVIAEDNSTKEYHITINRKEEERKTEEQIPVAENKEETQDNNNNNRMIIPLIVSSILVLVIIVLIVIVVKKKKHAENKRN